MRALYDIKEVRYHENGNMWPYMEFYYELRLALSTMKIKDGKHPVILYYRNNSAVEAFDILHNKLHILDEEEVAFYSEYESLTE